MHMRKGNVLPIALMALAIVGFLVMVDYSISGGKWPWSADKKNKVTPTTTNTAVNVNTDTNTTTNVNESTNTNTATNVNTSINTNTTTTEVLPTNVKHFTSSKLGITFTYLTTAKDYKATVQEIGDKVYINTNVSTTNPITSGQWVQVFSKDPADTITQAITKRFLSDISTQDCFVTVQSRTNISQTQSAAIIDWPATLIDDDNPFGDNSKCPKEYQKTNGERYFLTDSQDPTKLLFFSIGQYAIQGWNDNYETTWQQTLRMTAFDPTADWKTYTNTELGYALKYPSTWKTSTCADISMVAFGLQGLKCNTDAATEDFIVSKEVMSFNPEERITEVSKSLINPVRSTVVVDGIAATRITGTERKDENFFYGGGLYLDQVYLPKNGRYYRISYFIVSGEKKYVSEFDNFLSTFTFTN
jgi:hypothetical protein